MITAFYTLTRKGFAVRIFWGCIICQHGLKIPEYLMLLRSLLVKYLCKKPVRIAIAVFFAFITTFSFSANITVGNLFDGLPEKSLIYAVLFAFCVIIYFKSHFKTNVMPSALTVASLFSLLTVFGSSFEYLDSWDYVFHGPRQFLLAFIVIIGYALLFYAVLKLFLKKLDEGISFSSVSSKGLKWIESHFYFTAFIVIFACWIPYFLIFYPGSVPHDGYAQLNIFFGFWEKSNAHPYFSTLFMGAIMSIGRIINDNFGVFFFIVVQSLICSAIYALVCKKIRDLGMPLWMSIGTVAFYALVPMWPAYSQALTKDTLFYAFFALYVVLFIEILKNREAVLYRNLIFFTVISLLVCLFRNNGIYMLLPAGILLVFAMKKLNKIKVATAVLAMFLIYQAFSMLALPAMGVEKGPVREALSLPFQQTARYVRDHGDDVTEYEKQVIGKVLDYDNLAERYDPDTSDPVKNSSNVNASDAEILEYLSVWKDMLLRHPGTYIQATINNTYCYYYPFENNDIMLAYQMYTKGPPISTGDLDIHYVNDKTVIDSAKQYAQYWLDFPVISLLSNPGFYTWVIIVLIAVLLRRRKFAAMTALIAPLLNIAVCTASPVNGLLRYAMPLMACMPILIAFCFYELKVFKNKEVE